MKNYVQPGNTITLTAPYAVVSGEGLLVGSIFGVASGTAAPSADRPNFSFPNFSLMVFHPSVKG